MGASTMSIKRLTVGTIVGGIVLFALGYLIWDYLFVSFFAANQNPAAAALTREPLLFWAVTLGALSYALLIALGLEGRTAGATIVDGLKVGAIVGFLIWFTSDFTLYGIRDTGTLIATIVDPLLEGIRGAIAGAAIVASRRISG